MLHASEDIYFMFVQGHHVHNKCQDLEMGWMLENTFPDILPSTSLLSHELYMLHWCLNMTSCVFLFLEKLPHMGYHWHLTLWFYMILSHIKSLIYHINVNKPFTPTLGDQSWYFNILQFHRGYTILNNLSRLPWSTISMNISSVISYTCKPVYLSLTV